MRHDASNRRNRILWAPVSLAIAGWVLTVPAPSLWAEQAFQESGGQVVMEAENFDAAVPRSGHAWDLETASSGYSGSGYVRALPNNGSSYNTGYVTNSAETVYNVTFTTTGTYYVWLRGLGASGSDDSVHVGIDGLGLSTADRMALLRDWTWSRNTMDGAPATLTVSTPGLHTIHLWYREDGARVDKLLLRTDSSSSAPSGTGPVESPRGGGIPEPDVTAPEITNVVASDITTTTATITWTTDEPATSAVDYGDTTSYGQTESTTVLTTSHDVTLSGLSAGTPQYYQVRSQDAVGNEATVSGGTFTTDSLPEPPPPSGDLITNVIASSGKTYETDSLAVGARLYTDRTYTFTSVPAPYVGQEFIRPANNDKTLTASNALTFTLSAGATIYVAYDSRATQLPAWLDGTWVGTGESLMNSSGVPLPLYEKSFPSGTVTLGGNAMAPMSGSGTNYIVIAVAAGGAPPPDVTPPVTTATPAGGTYASSIDVTLTADESATMYYTTDGSMPTTGSSVYTAPISIGVDTTLRFFGKDAAGNTEAVHTEAYVINSSASPPSGSITINNGDAVTNDVNVILTLAATDDSGIVSLMQFSNDGAAYSAPEAYSGTKAWTLETGDGSKTVWVQFADPSGNWSAPVNAEITVDTVPPALSITDPVEGQVIPAPVP